jgi:SpoVK/Ycf46/Vps4 family AAA+-type ATPase
MISNKFLFYGPKGCGKSKFAKATFGEFSKGDPSWFTVEVQKARILESPLNNIKEILSLIHQYKINGILIEDFDALIEDLSNYTAAKRSLIEGIKKIGEKQLLIATTRHPEKIDEDVLLDFDVIAPFYYPDEHDRRDILRVHTQVIRNVVFEDSVDIDELAKKTPWFSGADLENLIIYASSISDCHAINNSAIDNALNHYSKSISISKRIQELQEVVDFAIKHCTINSVKEELLSYAKTLNISINSSENNEINVDLNKILELKPNFLGFGININEIIETIKRKFKKT